MLRSWAAGICLLGLVAPVGADEPAALYVFPAGGQRGTVVQARIGGMSLHESSPLHVEGSGLQASPTIRRIDTIWFEGPIIPQPDSQRAEDYPSDYAAQLTIDAQAPLGPRWWRISTSQGVTPARSFVVGDEPEVIEQEIDGAPLPVDVRLPVTINGRTFPREDIDLWRFTARRGEIVRCEVTAARLGSPLDAHLDILDEQGNLLASNSDHYGADPLILFNPPRDGVYLARIRDASFGGLQPYVYRLTLSTAPHVLSVYPLGGQRGTKLDCRWSGVALPEKPEPFTLPTTPEETYLHRFTVAGQTTNPVAFELSDLAELLEVEPNDAPEQALRLALPGVANGRIDRAGDVDLWAIEATKGETIDFEVRAAKLGSPLDAVLTVLDEEGKTLATADDASNVDSDPALRFAPPADGRYWVRVSEHFGKRGGVEFAYRLIARPNVAPDFGLTFAADAVTLYREGQARLKVNLQRHGGFAELVELRFEGLPDGVTLTSDRINKGQAETTVTFKASAEMPIRLDRVTVRGVATIDGQEVIRTARFAGPREAPPIERLWFSAALPTPFKVAGVFQLPYAPRGSSYRRHYALERTGYEGPVEITLAEKQMRHLQGVTGGKVLVPEGATEFDYVVFLPPMMELGRTSRSIVTASAWVDDGQGNKHRVASTSAHQNEQISLIISPGPLSMSLEPSSVAPEVERSVEIGVSVDRDPSVSGPLKVELIVPSHVQGIAAEPVIIPARQERGTLTLRFKSGAGPFNQPLSVRVTHGEGEGRFVVEEALEIVTR